MRMGRLYESVRQRQMPRRWCGAGARRLLQTLIAQGIIERELHDDSVEKSRTTII